MSIEEASKSSFFSLKVLIGYEISVIFRQNESGQRYQQIPTIEIKCYTCDKVSSLIERYREKSGDYDKNVKFIYNAKNLRVVLTVYEAGIIDNSNIFVFQYLKI